MSRFKKYVKPYLLYFILGPILMLAEVAGEVVLPKLVSVMIKEGVNTGDVRRIVLIGVLMAFSALIAMAGGLGGNYFAVKAAVSFATDLRYDIFSKVQKFSFKNVDKFSTGSLVTRITNDVTQIQNVIRMGIISLLRSPGMLVGALIMAMTVNKRLALVIAAVIPWLIAALAFILIKAFPKFDVMQKKLDNLNLTVQENITNVRVVKSFLREDFEEKKFVDANSKLKNATLSAMNLVICTNPVMTLATNITTIAVIWFGGSFVISNKMDLGDLTAFTSYIVQILMSLMMFSMIILQGSRAAASAKRIGEVLDTEISVRDDEAHFPNLKVERGKVEFKNVSFKYNENDDENILKNINFTVEPGETVGIIGITGCGKTSLVQLIPRLFDVTEGEVTVDGVDVRDYTLKNLRQGIAMVLQKNVLFSGTVEENIRWGNENADFEEIKKSAENAQADMFISGLSDGYGTMLEQGGMNLSGGQKQRLCIARALAGKPKILILDDSTSAVDTATEANIRRYLKNEKGTTKIIIAQRIQSVIEADKILVMRDGEIVGSGTHGELIENNEEYKEIYYSQADKEVTA